MYTTEIKINDRTIPLKFSFLTVRELEKRGFPVADLKNAMETGYTDLLVEVVRTGAMTAVKAHEDVLSEDDVIEWVDANGFLSETVQDVFLLFVRSQTEGVSKNSKAVKPKKKATPQK